MELAPQVEDLAKAIQSLPSLLEAVNSLPISGWVVLVAFFLWFVANKNLSRVFDVLWRKEKRKLEQLDTYISSPAAGDENAIKAIRDLRDARYFKMATGIYAESRVRNAFIRLHEATSHLVTWRHICRAHPYLKVAADETVIVKDLDFSEKLSYWYNQLVGYLFLLLAATLVSLAILSGSKTVMSFSFGFGGGILSALFAMFVFSQNWPIHAAQKIAKELDRQRNTNPNA
jgi:hypothetical protein